MSGYQWGWFEPNDEYDGSDLPVPEKGTYGVKQGLRLICLTSRYKHGYENALAIASALNQTHAIEAIAAKDLHGGDWTVEDETLWRAQQNMRAGKSIKLAPYRCPNCDHELIVDYGTLEGDTFTPKQVLDQTGVEERPFWPDRLGYGTNVFPAWIAAMGTHQLQIAYAKLEKEIREIRRTRLGRLAWKVHGRDR